MTDKLQQMAGDVKAGALLGAVALVVGVGAAIYIERKKIVTAINPADPNNLVNSQVSKLVQSASGGKYQDLGQAIYYTQNSNPVSGAIGGLFNWIGHATGQLHN